ncbi:g-type lectin s-receptor-like serine/threonine-protein kinase [Quercus suber]|uniref:G-type lectin s-receptor-like serine/threonine-protein kinase n=1 Tax=Quercus suber TaxID=58331 RepID=A0AAW0KK22_QUESU
MVMNTQREILSCRSLSLRNGRFGRTSSRCTLRERFMAGKGIMSQNGLKFSDKLTLNDCEAVCKNYCFCQAYACTNDDETGCEIWDGMNKFQGE